MIDIYFLLKKPNEEVGGISLLEKRNNLDIWTTYKIYPITEKTVMFKNNRNEFCTINGVYNHEMGKIKVKYINDEWININVNERFPAEDPFCKLAEILNECKDLEEAKKKVEMHKKINNLLNKE